MSGICGLFNLDGAPVAVSELPAMTAMLERRGPDSASHWTDGPVGLATWNAVSHFDNVLVQPYVSGMSINGQAVPSDVATQTDRARPTQSARQMPPQVTPQRAATALPMQVLDRLFADYASHEFSPGDVQETADLIEPIFGDATDT